MAIIFDEGTKTWKAIEGFKAAWKFYGAEKHPQMPSDDRIRKMAYEIAEAIYFEGLNDGLESMYEAHRKGKTKEWLECLPYDFEGGKR